MKAPPRILIITAAFGEGHNSAARNRANYNLLGREGDNRTLIPGRGHRLLNNLGFSGGTEVTQLDAAACEVRGNTWQLTESFTQVFTAPAPEIHAEFTLRAPSPDARG